MIGQDRIKEKVNYYYKEQCKVHLTKNPTAKFPNGKFYNGFITEVFNDKISFLDDVEFDVVIPFFDLADIEEFKEDVKNG